MGSPLLNPRVEKYQLQRKEPVAELDGGEKLMSHTKWIAIATATLLTGMTMGPAAFAENGMQNGSLDQQNMTSVWNKLDANHDGSISMSEHQRHADQMFKNADTNGDGKLSKQESRTAMQSMHHGNTSQDHFNDWWNKVDTNGDGSISMSEHRAYMDQMFRKADRNGDGKLSQSEFQMAMQKMGH